MEEEKYLSLDGLTDYDSRIKAIIEEVRQLANGKANASHNHAASNITSGTLSSDRLPTVPISKGGTGSTTAAGALTNLGLTATAAELNKMDGVTATTTELNYVDGVTSNIQSQLDGKLSLSGGTISSSFFGSLGVTRSGSTNGSAIKFSNSNGTLGYIGMTGSANGGLLRYSADTNSSYTILDSSNYNNYAPTKTGTGASGTWGISISGNAATATKLTTARTIGLGTGATGTATSFNGTGNITIPVTDIKESYLSWGGKNLSGSVSPIDAASSSIHSANRFAFAKPAGITVEYSTDGSTYSTYSTTDSAKINLVSGNGNTYYIGARSTSTTVNDKLRITLNATSMGVYTRLRKLLINISTSYATGSNVIIEKAMKGSETTFSTVGTYTISGWSGWNSIPVSAAFGGGSTQTGNVAVLRLTFGITGVNANQTSNALQVMDIIGIGDTYWSYPSTMSKTGHLYSYDSSQNATFPAQITATAFNGNATTATTATKLGTANVGSATQPFYLNAGVPTACTYTLSKSVPSNAVFTDTNTKMTQTVSTTSANYPLLLAPSGQTATTTTTGYFGTKFQANPSTGVLTATTFSGALSGNASTATKLASAKTLQTNLASTSAVGFDGSENKTIGVTGTLPIVNGGTGATTAAAALTKLGLTATAAELNYCDGVTSSIQTQLNTKSDNDHRHYAINISVTGQDLNDYTDAGTYTFTAGAAVANAPSGNTNGWLVVIPWVQGNSTIKQLWFRHGTVGSNDTETYVRTKVGSGSWGAWTRYFTTTGGTITGTTVFKKNIRMGTNGEGEGAIEGLAPDGTTYVKNLQPCNENGNCTVGFGNYDRGEGITNVYGENVNIYALNTDGTQPSGTIFTARNANNHTLINYTSSLDTAKTSDTYIYGSGVHVRSNNDDFTVDNIQLAHIDSATCTVASGWEQYTSGNSTYVDRYGKVVTLSGVLKNSSAVTINTTKVKMFTVPSGYRPKRNIYAICQGSGQNKWMLEIGTDGVAYAQRYGVSSYSEVSAGSWFPFSATWIIP